jgi:mono/diheme cytochrome c family protein
VSRARRTSALVCIAGLLGSAAAGGDESASPVHYPDGAAAFQTNCAVCHRANGAGQAGLAPPLLRYPARYVESAEGRRQLVLTLIYGMFGEIVVDGHHFNFKMPEFSRFDDATIAATVNYVVFDLSRAQAAAEPLRPEEVARERALGLGGDEVRRHRAQVLAAMPP